MLRSRPGLLILMSVLATTCLFGVAGGGFMHRTSPQVPTAETKPAQTDSLDYFVGSWHCKGSFARSGAAIEADLRFDKDLDGKWLLFHHDDRPPNRYHALAEWRGDGQEWKAAIQDSFGGLRLFHSKGWEGSRLVWEGDDLAAKSDPRQHFIFERTDQASIHVTYELEVDGQWRLVDSSSCLRK